MVVGGASLSTSQKSRSQTCPDTFTGDQDDPCHSSRSHDGADGAAMTRNRRVAKASPRHRRSHFHCEACRVILWRTLHWLLLRKASEVSMKASSTSPPPPPRSSMLSKREGEASPRGRRTLTTPSAAAAAAARTENTETRTDPQTDSLQTNGSLSSPIPRAMDGESGSCDRSTGRGAYSAEVKTNPGERVSVGVHQRMSRKREGKFTTFTTTTTTTTVISTKTMRRRSTDKGRLQSKQRVPKGRFSVGGFDDHIIVEKKGSGDEHQPYVETPPHCQKGTFTQIGGTSPPTTEPSGSTIGRSKCVTDRRIRGSEESRVDRIQENDERGVITSDRAKSKPLSPGPTALRLSYSLQTKRLLDWLTQRASMTYQEDRQNTTFIKGSR